MAFQPIRSKKVLILFLVLLAGVFFCAKIQEISPSPLSEVQNRLAREEEEAGWILLFDGQSLDGWRGIGQKTVPPGHWMVEDGWIKKIPSGEVPLQEDGQPLTGGDIMTVETFEDFELRLEWKISPGGNSGVKYNVSEEMSVSHPPEHAALGFEYQILDDDLHPEGQRGPKYRSAGLYDLIGPEEKALRPAGEVNSSRIVFLGSCGEHWLNGTKVLEYDIDTSDFHALLAVSKYKDFEGFGQKRKGHIVLQDHTDAVWFRNIKIRSLKKGQ